MELRQQILNRIEYYSYKENGFDSRSRKWEHVCIHNGNLHISCVNFSTLEDDELLEAYERIVLVSARQV